MGTRVGGELGDCEFSSTSGDLPGVRRICNEEPGRSSCSRCGLSLLSYDNTGEFMRTGVGGGLGGFEMSSASGDLSGL